MFSYGLTARVFILTAVCCSLISCKKETCTKIMEAPSLSVDFAKDHYQPGLEYHIPVKVRTLGFCVLRHGFRTQKQGLTRTVECWIEAEECHPCDWNSPYLVFDYPMLEKEEDTLLFRFYDAVRDSYLLYQIVFHDDGCVCGNWPH